MNFFSALEPILETSTPTAKAALFEQFYAAYTQNYFSFEKTQPKEFDIPSYAKICKVVSPRDVPKRTNLTTKEGKIYLLHAIAHIEYSAIDLALDICYRFQDMPKEFYDDWLEVANDEIRHFFMLHNLLEELGAKYSDIVVHNSLFEASQRTAHSLLERLAVVPRYLEANGLDATPMILEKIKRLPKEEFFNKIIDALEIILEEEIEHVAKGDRWFEYVCAKNNLPSSSYIDVINKYYPNGFAKLKKLNVEARLEAGFSCEELKHMTKKEVCNN